MKKLIILFCLLAASAFAADPVPVFTDGTNFFSGASTSSLTTVCGQLYMDGTQEQNMTAAYTYITNMLSTNLSGGVSASNSNLTVTVAGHYYCSFSISFQGGVNEIFEMAVHVNSVESNNIEARRKTATTDTGCVAAGGILSLSANDVLDLRVKSLDAAADFDPIKVQLTVHKLP